MKDKMKHHWVEKLITTPSKELSPDQHRQLNEHLATCTDCMSIRREYDILRDRVRNAAVSEPAPDLTPQLLQLRKRNIGQQEQTSFLFRLGHALSELGHTIAAVFLYVFKVVLITAVIVGSIYVLASFIESVHLPTGINGNWSANNNGGCNGVANCSAVQGNPTAQVAQIQYEDLGSWSYWHEDGPYPQPPANGAIVAYGDIQNDGQCHIRIFYGGNTVANLGHGTFRLVKLTGRDRDAILQYIRDTIQPQLQPTYGSCPII